MADPILVARLEALKSDLDRAARTEWLKTVANWRENVDNGVWTGLESTIGRAAKTQIDRLDEALLAAKNGGQSDGEQTPQQLWQVYWEVQQESHQLFGEFLEFIAGLAFRDANLDDSICRVADDLVHSCSLQTVGRDDWQSITVPALEETVPEALARVIRLRFPEQTIWTLPFTAHEYGHVIMKADTTLSKFIRDEAAKMASGLVPAKKRKATKRAEAHLRELAADIYATYYLGPAYAASALHLRLSPTTATETDERPSDLRRAHVILATLEAMNSEPGALSVYAGLLTQLRDSWNVMADRGGGEPGVDAKHLDGFVAGLRKQFLQAFVGGAQYPSGSPGWMNAAQWASEWTQQLGTAVLTIPAAAQNEPDADNLHVRDALNAAWQFRLAHPDLGLQQRIQVQEATLNLCELIRARRNKAVADRKKPTRLRSPRGV